MLPARDKLQILIRNVRQILAIVTATLGGSTLETLVSEQDCLHPTSPAAELVCEWRTISEIIEQAATNSSQYQDRILHISRVSAPLPLLSHPLVGHFPQLFAYTIP